MDLTIAFGVVVSVAVVLVWLAFVRLSFEVRSLRGQLDELRRRSEDHIQLPADWSGAGTVLAVDSTCAACWAAVEEASTVDGPKPVLLVHEPVDSFSAVAEKFTIREDPAAWGAISHLSTPILLRVAADGSVGDLTLPTRTGDVRDALHRWTTTKGKDRDAQLV